MIGKILAIYAEYGFSLRSQDMGGAVLPITVAIEVLPMFNKANLLILGGDIMKKLDGKFIYTYDNWSYDGNDVREGCSAAIDYLNLFSDKKEFLYVDFVIAG